MSYCISFVYVTYCAIAGTINVNKCHVRGVMWIMLIPAGAVFSVVLFTVFTHYCNNAICGVRCCKNVHLLVAVAFRNAVMEIINFQGCIFRKTSRSARKMREPLF